MFDQIKNKQGEKKAWGTSLIAKEAQAQLIAITHNLLLLYEQRLENEHGVTNHAEDQRRAKRIQAVLRECEKIGQPLSSLVQQARRATQRSVKFVRWVRQSIRDHAAEAAAALRLQVRYATRAPVFYKSVSSKRSRHPVQDWSGACRMASISSRERKPMSGRTKHLHGMVKIRCSSGRRSRARTAMT